VPNLPGSKVPDQYDGPNATPARQAPSPGNTREDHRLNVIQPKGLDHIVLRVSNMERSIAFYRDVLGCLEERRVDELGLVQLRAGNSLVDLVDVASPLGKAGGNEPIADGRNMDHFALSVTRFDEASIRTHLSRFDVEASETRRLYGAEGYGPSIYLRDPDGNTVELKGPSDD
jgi:glyoxylase I family protein